ncbi:pyruvate, phosphate dikinase [Gordonia otitidis]|uniref:Pyruvate phosphate dikinase n=1 Tax=Gordonia otitidis (strain DSM 44809 / CCUG 52243 / JCM 12355 / NBRC 100426 / IFM 10032) TaxID=1108044 RepID=H5TN23_GORO1|nr:pyruvate, phosphate dikinase [Gordonia otitidis]GAB34881.1 putative pyruvate phosphate dikinase [Gordonia otitidis NBRC 100426]
MTAQVTNPSVLRITELDDEPARELVGGKAWSLWRMSALGLRVPPAFVVTTTSCADYFASGKRLSDELFAEIVEGVSYLEDRTGRTFGRGEHPLLVSVRSGAAVSMPGMMDTILNLGINPDTESALAAETSHADFAADVHRRFVALYGKLVSGCVEDLEDLPDTAAVTAAIADETGDTIPTDPMTALRKAVAAVFDSSQSRRAKAYRAHYGIPDDIGTAVTVQAMVFGNLDENSGTGVLFTRNPLTGAKDPYGEYLPRGQGEDVVSGRVTPQPLAWLASNRAYLHDELIAAADLLDREGADAQDIEFTVQHGELYLLQSRPAKRTARAAVRIAAALVGENAIEEATACSRVTADQVRHLLRPSIDADAVGDTQPLATGVSASPGYAVGRVVLTADEAQRNPGSILVRESTSPEDVHGMIAASAVVTEHGGATSHAAVVSRALDTPCVVGCGAGTAPALAGRIVTVDATGARIFDGEIGGRATRVDDDADLAALARWAAAIAPLRAVSETAQGVEVFDADAAIAASGGETVEIPENCRVVTGAYFETDAGVSAALDAGVEVIVTTTPLPVLLAAVAHRKADR